MGTLKRDTVATLLTAAGRGAVATIAVDGPSAPEIVSQCFEPLSGRPLTSYGPGAIVVGQFRNANGSSEELVVGLVADDRVEVHCHGGRAAIQAVLQTLAAAGCREATWQRRIEEQSPDPIAAEGWIALADATTERTAGLLLDQIRGVLRRELETALQATRRGDLARAGKTLADLLDRGRAGLHLTQPWRIVIAGPPNVGKSSLINALVGYERAIVFDRPGTTRDLLSARTALDGWPVELTDTAGLRESNDQLEAAGIAKAEEALAAGDLVLAVFEAGEAWTSDNAALLSQVARHDHLIVYNKLDLGPAANDGRPAGIAISARTGEGLEALTERIVARLTTGPIEPGTAVPFTQRQLAAIEAASQALALGDEIVATSSLQTVLTPPRRSDR